MQRVLGRDAAVRVRRRRAVDVGRERAEALLVDELRRHRHRQVRAAVERAVEDDDAGAAGRRARDLDGVLDRLRARVQRAASSSRRCPGQSSSSFSATATYGSYVADHEALVEEAVDLLVDRPDDGRVAVAEVLAGDAAGEVDVLAALGVPDPGAPGARDDEIGGRDAARDVPLPPLAHLVRGRLFLDPHRSGVSHYRNARQMGALTYAMRSRGRLAPMRPLSPQFRPYGWALSTAEIAARAGIAPEDVLRFDGNTPPDPPPTARPETIADALERIQSYRHGGFPELLRAIADYNGARAGERRARRRRRRPPDALRAGVRRAGRPGRDRERAVLSALPRRRVGDGRRRRRRRPGAHVRLPAAQPDRGDGRASRRRGRSSSTRRTSSTAARPRSTCSARTT